MALNVSRSIDEALGCRGTDVVAYDSRTPSLGGVSSNAGESIVEE